MSDTPRTDAAQDIARKTWETNVFVTAVFARTIERELGEAFKAAAALEAQVKLLQQECARNNGAAQTWDRLSLEAKVRGLEKELDVWNHRKPEIDSLKETRRRAIKFACELGEGDSCAEPVGIIKEKYNQLKLRAEKAETELAELRKDKERLDWLETYRGGISISKEVIFHNGDSNLDYVMSDETFRLLIDKAIETESRLAIDAAKEKV